MKKFIDIEEAIKSKNPKLLKWLPGFLLRYIKRITHESDINDIMSRFKDKSGKDFCTAVVEDFNIKVNSFGLENIPKKGGYLFVANHPLGGLDALAIVHAIHEIRPDIKFIVNDILLNIDNMKSMFEGVNKHGSTAKESMKAVMKLFAGDNAVFIFPAGLVSRKLNGVVTDLEWKKTFITQAKRNNRTVIPVYVDGHLSNFFYRLANLRKWLGIKANIEMMYLSDELFKTKNSTTSLVFGEEIPASTFDNTKSDLEWTNWVRKKVYALQELIEKN